MDELRNDYTEVADDAEGCGASIASDLCGGDIDLDKSGRRVPFWGIAEMENPVQSGTQEENHVCFLQSGAAGAGGV